eukprot:scaffold16060_cov107-Isochrysis_galbana.AAC.3
MPPGNSAAASASASADASMFGGLAVSRVCLCVIAAPPNLITRAAPGFLRPDRPSTIAAAPERAASATSTSRRMRRLGGRRSTFRAANRGCGTRGRARLRSPSLLSPPLQGPLPGASCLPPCVNDCAYSYSQLSPWEHITPSFPRERQCFALPRYVSSCLVFGCSLGDSGRDSRHSRRHATRDRLSTDTNTNTDTHRIWASAESRRQPPAGRAESGQTPISTASYTWGRPTAAWTRSECRAPARPSIGSRHSGHPALP